MSLYFVPGSVSVIQNPFFGESRLQFDGVEEAPSEKKGIRFHSSILAFFDTITHFFLKIFGYQKKTFGIADVDGKVYYLNRADLNRWLVANSKLNEFTIDPMSLTETFVLDILSLALREKSPEVIVKLYDVKRELIKAKMDLEKDNFSQEILDKISKLSSEHVSLAKQRVERLYEKVLPLGPKLKSVVNVELINNLAKLNLKEGENNIAVAEKEKPKEPKVEEVPMPKTEGMVSYSQIYNNDSALLVKELRVFRKGDDFQILEKEVEEELLSLNWGQVFIAKDAKA